METVLARLESHSKYVIHEILPRLDHLAKQMEQLWMSDNQFKELEEAVADLAHSVYESRTEKRIDSRRRPCKNSGRDMPYAQIEHRGNEAV
jgi:hypothetical protein